MIKSHSISSAFCSAVAMAWALAPAQVQAQSQASEAAVQAEDSGQDSSEIVVTATKKGAGETVQNVALAITAVSGARLDETAIKSLRDLSYSVPNVQLDTIGTNPGSLNYSIRGLGINSSVPTVEPYVGLFIDGVYIGAPTGPVGGAQIFDLEGVEILRGPQGVLFGRNVVGGAVLLRTSRPTNELTSHIRLGYESGETKIASAVVSGPIVKDVLTAKIAAYYSDEEGYFTNEFTGRPHGANRIWIVRPAAELTVGDATFALKLEHGYQFGDASAGQNSVRDGMFRNNRRFSNNYTSFAGAKWNQAIFQADVPVSLGDGVITNVFGYRDLKTRNGLDVDGLPQNFFLSFSRTQQDQVSNELRYFGTFGKMEITTGFFYFQQTTEYIQRRILNGTSVSNGGGRQFHKAYAGFLNGDWHITDTLTASAGIRYSWERKRAEVNALNATSPCSLETFSCDSYAFNDSNSWDGFTPKFGLQWKPNNDLQVYASYSGGLRSGGYNIAANPIPPELNPGNLAKPVGPTEQETAKAYEIGLKRRFGRGSFLNIAAFRTDLSNIQRTIIFPTPSAGTVTFVANTGDVRIQGVEAEARWQINDQIAVYGNFGHVEGKYSNIIFDISGDGVVDAKDQALKSPRLAPWVYGFGADFLFDLGVGKVDANVEYSYRDAEFQTDNNLLRYRSAKFLNAGIGFSLPSGLRLSIYGKNLTNRISYASSVTLGVAQGGVGSQLNTLNKGRVVGGELSYRF